MAAPAKTTDDAIAAAARQLFESGGADFSMAAVAAATGVKTPSLYKRFADRSALLARVRRDAYDELGAVIGAAARGSTDRAKLRAMAVAYRAFALAHPRLYALLFSPEEIPDASVMQARAASAVPLLEILRRAAGPARALDAARTLTAFMHGHVTMVLAGAFQLGGDVDAAFAYGVERVLDGVLRREGP